MVLHAFDFKILLGVRIHEKQHALNLITLPTALFSRCPLHTLLPSPYHPPIKRWHFFPLSCCLLNEYVRRTQQIGLIAPSEVPKKVERLLDKHIQDDFHTDVGPLGASRAHGNDRKDPEGTRPRQDLQTTCTAGDPFTITSSAFPSLKECLIDTGITSDDGNIVYGSGNALVESTPSLFTSATTPTDGPSVSI